MREHGGERAIAHASAKRQAAVEKCLCVTARPPGLRLFADRVQSQRYRIDVNPARPNARSTSGFLPKHSHTHPLRWFSTISSVMP